MKKYLNTLRISLLSYTCFTFFVVSAIILGMSSPQSITTWLKVPGSVLVLGYIFSWLEGKLRFTEADEIGKGWYRFGQISIWLGMGGLIVTASYMMILHLFSMFGVIDSPINPRLVVYPSLYIFIGLNLTSVICLFILYMKKAHLLEVIITRALSRSD